MKKFLIIHSNMELGGAETSLIGLLQNIDYSEWKVDLMLLEQKGELMEQIPNEVNLLQPAVSYQCLALPIKDVLLQKRNIGITAARIYGKIRGRKYAAKTYATKQFAHHASLPFLPKIDGEYDLAISFIDPHFILTEKVNAKRKMGWFHTDFSRIEPNEKLEHEMWSGCDYIVNVSESTKKAFDMKHPEFVSRSIVIENMLSPKLINYRACVDVSDEICPDENITTICSVGRFSEAKNYDNVPEICSNILKQGLNIRWYLVGYGGDEALIRSKIEEFKMQDNVIIIGKRENPYPYMKSCDIYAQPSRYEGNSVCVHEAQVLGKPVVITNYATAKDQLSDGFDGVIVPMDNEGCAKGIADLINNKPLREHLSENCLNSDYSNAQGIETLRKIIEEN